MKSANKAIYDMYKETIKTEKKARKEARKAAKRAKKLAKKERKAALKYGDRAFKMAKKAPEIGDLYDMGNKVLDQFDKITDMLEMF